MIDITSIGLAITITLGILGLGIRFYTIHVNSKQEFKVQIEKVTRLEAGLSGTRKQLDHLSDDHKTLRTDVQSSLDRVYDKMDNIHDLVVQIALNNKGSTT